MIFRRRLVSEILLAAAIATVGCGRPGPLLVPISGVVTLDGKPLPAAEVSFISPTLGHLETFAVKDGAFTGHARPGLRRVEFYAFRDVPPDPQAPATRLKVVSIIPDKYSSNSTLTADVTETGPNTFTFDLTTGK